MNDIRPWLALKSVPGIGNHLFKRLIHRFHSPGHVFGASQDALAEVEGLTARLARRIKTHVAPIQIDEELELTTQKGYTIITMSDPQYPPLLKQIPDPPPFLYAYGTLPAGTKNIAIVGSRNATDYGISTTNKLCRDLVSLGFIIVSGMALGIDTAAHTGALQGGGQTVAVLGSGLEQIYPRENRSLFHRIAENGAVISEFSLYTDPEGHNFPIRNRIISGICLGTIVVEATKKSGSLITARLAAEQNREVFAIPGSVQSFKSIGTHHLLKQGAKLVEHAQDVVDEFPPGIHAAAPGPVSAPTINRPTLSAVEATIFEALEAYPLHIDVLIHKTALNAGKILSILLGLELKGIVQQHPGKHFSLCEGKD